MVFLLFIKENWLLGYKANQVVHHAECFECDTATTSILNGQTCTSEKST